MLKPIPEVLLDASALMPCSHKQTPTVETRQGAIHCEFSLEVMLVPPSTTEALKKPPAAQQEKA